MRTRSLGCALFFLAAGALAQTRAHRIAAAPTCVDMARQQPWGVHIKQIPATVIDKGVLAYVPYMSYRAGDYEVNVYGDPANPSGFECGVYGDAAKTFEPRKACYDLVKLALVDSTDRDVLRELRTDKDLKESRGLTFEVTPATASDAYGGWWVSVYDKVAMGKAKASETEIAAVTEPRSAPTTWTNNDISSAPSRSYDTSSTRGSAGSSSSESSGGRVYVHAYTRKDGTYVPAYTRSAPSRHK